MDLEDEEHTGQPRKVEDEELGELFNFVLRNHSLQRHLEWPGKQFPNAKRKMLQKRPNIKLRT